MKMRRKLEGDVKWSSSYRQRPVAIAMTVNIDDDFATLEGERNKHRKDNVSISDLSVHGVVRVCQASQCFMGKTSTNQTLY